MPFQRLLDDLVRGLPGARGAVLLDSQGELVVETGGRDERRLLIGAYQGIGLASLERLAERHGCGSVRQVVCRYERGHVVICPLRDGYYFIVCLDPGPGLGVSLVRAAAVQERLKHEI